MDLVISGTATDALGNTARASVTVTVNPPAAPERGFLARAGSEIGDEIRSMEDRLHGRKHQPEGKG